MAKATKDVLLSSNFTIENINVLLNAGETSRQELARFVFERLTERYIVPMEHVEKPFKNGFSIMANCCLLIETYQCFKFGLNDTLPKGQGVRVFKDFFDNEANFTMFKGLGDQFYFNIRCGILHQGETKKGWSISRKSSDPLFNKTELTINANHFLEKLRNTIKEYAERLEIEEWANDPWVRCKEKINFIITNCTK